jgi:hypothetical protein
LNPTEANKPLVDKIINKISGWKGKLLSHAARVMLIKTCIASILVYLLSFIKFPKWAIKAISSQIANCLWNDNEDRHRWHLVNWEKVSMKKEFGGLGIPNLRDLNICLLGSWLKIYQLDQDKPWKQVIDEKYKTRKPNILHSPSEGTSQFFRGIMWAVKATKMGYRWKIGDGKRVKFWEDNWLGTSSLAIQFWDLYVILNENNKIVHDLWDGTNLKCSFRRTVDESLMRTWEEVTQLASTIVFSEGQDEMIWTFSSNGVYSSRSLYKIVNFRGIMPIHTPAVWSLKVPPRVHGFLWLLTQNKTLTRDNVGKRKQVADKSCLFCNELESIHHMFFDCVVARQVWANISECLDLHCGESFESIGKRWLSTKKFMIANIFTFAALWGLWKLRNYLCFQDGRWKDMNSLLRRITTLIYNWKLLCPDSQKSELESRLSRLNCLARQPRKLAN